MLFVKKKLDSVTFKLAAHKKVKTDFIEFLRKKVYTSEYFDSWSM